ncbi:hypothetical protein F5Y16DRAFT_357816 [Xylariaceae sp. FL0255]|nr:hypothetical protein F5Y16DRAFT_357816 [Xylariaceae sp. FL0255]
MLKIPLKIQIGIRDHWESSDAPVNQAIKELENTSGYGVRVQPEWHPLLAELDTFYPDKSTFVPCVAAAVIALCTALTMLINDETHVVWADKFMEHIDHQIKVSLEVSQKRDVKLSWSEQQQGFVIAFAKGPIPSQSHLRSLFSGELIQCFDKTSSTSEVVPAATDDWADVSVDNTTGKPGVAELPERPKGPSIPDSIPDIHTVARPDDLLLKPPYHLVVYDMGRSLVEVQCSHSPTLVFLSEYLKKWSKINHNNTKKPPRADVKLGESAFGLGLMYDRLTITSEEKYIVQDISAVLVVALVEGVLGYKIVSTDRSMWSFRRDVEFRP